MQIQLSYCIQVKHLYKMLKLPRTANLASLNETQQTWTQNDIKAYGENSVCIIQMRNCFVGSGCKFAFILLSAIT